MCSPNKQWIRGRLLKQAALVLLASPIALLGCSGSSAPSTPAPSASPSASAPSTASTAEPAAGKSAEPVAEGWGDLKGRFVFDGTPPTPAKLSVTKDIEVCGVHDLFDETLKVGSDGGIANIVVYVRTKDPKVHADYEATANDKVVLDNKNCRFEPHVLPIRLTQTLVLKNSDTVGHNSNVQPLADAPANPLIAAGSEAEHTFNREQAVPVPVSCNIHPWMRAYVLPRGNPYVAVSADDGTFTIKNLPSGDLEFQVWHETGYVEAPGWERGRFTMTIKPGENDLGEIKLGPDVLKVTQ